jgi:signal transduction histidine kinase
MTNNSDVFSGQQIQQQLVFINDSIKARKKDVEKHILQLMHYAYAQQNENLLAQLYTALAKTELLLKFNNQKAIEYGLLSKEHLDESSDTTTHINTLTILGRAFQRTRDYATAQNYFLEALSLFNNSEICNNEQQENLAYLNIFLGTLYVNIGMNSFAGEYFNTARVLFLQLNDQKGLLIAQQSLASYYFHQEEYDKALAIFEPLIETYENTDDENLQIVLDYSSQIFRDRNNYEKALEYQLRALAVRKLIGNEARLSYSYFSLAKIYYKTNRNVEGDKYFELLKSVMAKHPDFFTENLTLDVFWDLYGEKGEYEKSYNYYKQIKAHVAEPEVLEKMMRTILENEREKQQQASTQAQELRNLNNKMNEYAMQLEATNKDLKNYAHVTSHDLREPLRMVSTYMSILEAKLSNKLDEQEKTFLRFAVDGSRRMDEMITTLLDAAKGTKTKEQTIDLNKTLETVKQNLFRLMEDKNVVLHHTALPIILGNEIQFTQVFQNLITNAIKYNTSTQPMVHISAEKIENHWLLSVADNGVGIPEEKRKTVFEMFSRVENESNEDGTGIGLSTVQKIIHKMTGEIWIENNKPQGTVFKIKVKQLAVV